MQATMPRSTTALVLLGLLLCATSASARDLQATSSGNGSGNGSGNIGTGNGKPGSPESTVPCLAWPVAVTSPHSCTLPSTTRMHQRLALKAQMNGGYGRGEAETR